jgi:hypothetical protein
MAASGRKGGSGVVHLNGVARSKGKEKKGRTVASLLSRGKTWEGKRRAARRVMKEGEEGEWVRAGSRRCVLGVRVPGRQRRGGGGYGRAAREAGEQSEERGPGAWAIMGWLPSPARNEP